MDVVVTCPKALWWDWLEEGDLPGESWDGESEYHFFGRGGRPAIEPGERVYVVAHGRLRGYAPLVGIDVFSGTYIATFKPRTFTTAVHRLPEARLLYCPAPDWWWPGSTYGLVRRGGAIACTIPTPIRGFQGWRYRFWEREEEIAFPEWQTEGVTF